MAAHERAAQPSGPGQPPPTASANCGIGGQRPARISSATAVTILEEEPALRRNHSNAVASSLSWVDHERALGLLDRHPGLKGHLEWAASRPLTWAWAAAASRLATTAA